MGRNRQDRYAALGSISSVEASRQTGQETGLYVQELRAKGEHLHAVEGILSGAGSPGTNNQRGEL